MRTAGDWRAIEPRDDAPHEHGGEQGWSERISFNFFDAEGFGGIASMEFRPGERTADSALSLFLPEGAFATSLSKATDVKRAEMHVGRMRFETEQAGERWTLHCKDVALVFPTAEAAALKHQERHGAAAQIEVTLRFDAMGPLNGAATRTTEINDQGFTSVVSSGAFEQPGRYSGSLRVGNRRVEFSGRGFRERTWGVQPWTADAQPEVSWWSVAFDDDTAVSVWRRWVSGNQLGHAAVYRDGKTRTPKWERREDVLEGKGFVYVMDGEGDERIEIHAREVARIEPRAGEPPFVRAMVRFRRGPDEALGLLEYLT